MKNLNQLGSQFTRNTLAIEGIKHPPFYLSSAGYVVDGRKNTKGGLFRIRDSKQWRTHGEKIVAMMNKYAE